MPYADPVVQTEYWKKHSQKQRANGYKNYSHFGGVK